MSLLDTASLIVTPNAVKEGKLYSVIPSDGSGDLSVTRATTATRVNSAGLVELVPYNYKVQSENLTLGVGLDDANITTITANTTETLDPFGGYNAEKYNGSTNQYADTYNFIPQNSVITSSVYVKAGTATSFTLRLNASFGTFAFATFDLTNGTITGTGTDGFAYISSAVTAVGNGWYRCSLTYNFISFPTNRILLSQNGSIYVFGWQLVEGSTAKDYQKTETRLNIPRLDYSNGTCPSLLVEPQRTNLLTYSSSFDNAAWLLYQSSITANSTISPSGVQDADTMVATLNSTGVVYRSALTGANTSTFSFYIKAGTSSSLQYGVADGGTDYDVFVNLSTGTITSITSGITATITELENGWYRCSLTRAMTGNGTIYVNNLATTAGQTMFIWGAQLEAGSYATSYIPTTSASVTRNVDLVAKTGISSLIGQTEGTCFIDFNYDNSTAQGNPLLFSFRNTAWTNEVYAQILASGGIQVQTYLGGAQQSYLYYGGATNGHHKIAYAYKQNDFILYVDGVQVATDTSGNVPTTDDFCLGYFNTSFTPTANYNAAALWKTRLTNTQLAQLTSI